MSETLIPGDIDAAIDAEEKLAAMTEVEREEWVAHTFKRMVTHITGTATRLGIDEITAVQLCRLTDPSSVEGRVARKRLAWIQRRRIVLTEWLAELARAEHRDTVSVVDPEE